MVPDGLSAAVLLAALAVTGCAAPAAVPAAPAAVSGAPDVPPGWTAVTTPDSQALAFRCAISGQQMSVTVWNISAVREQAWHLTVIPYRGRRQIGTMSLDAGDNWVQPGQKMTFSEAVYGPATACRVTGLA